MTGRGLRRAHTEPIPIPNPQKMKYPIWALGAMLLLLFACKPATKDHAPMQYQQEDFGSTPAGQTIEKYTFQNAAGMKVSILTYGAIVQSIQTPDRQGNLAEISLGFDDLEGYLGIHPYFGAVVGRYGNRIANGRFSLDEIEYRLAVNNGANHLHGGLKGFDKQVWSVQSVEDDHIRLRYISVDGEEGYPGKLTVDLTYTLTPDNALQIDYQATTDQSTVVNLTNHTYFNLKDGGRSPVGSHELQILADRFTPVDETLIPLGELRAVEGTPFDFRTAKPIGQDINVDSGQVRIGGGYDHNFVLNNATGDLSLAARVYEPETGRTMEVLTREPGVQFYTGNFLDGTVVGKGGAYQHRTAFCLETQHFPDSPNQPQFPSVVLKPGETYATTTVYRFGTR